MFYNLISLEFWEMAKPKEDENKGMASEMPGFSHELEVARRFSGNSEYRSQLQELSSFIARGGLVTHNQTGPCTSQQIPAETDDLRRTWKLYLGFQPQSSSDLDPTFRKHKSLEIKILLPCILAQN